MLVKLSVDGRLSICAGTLNELPIMLSNKLTSEFQSRSTVKRKRKKTAERGVGSGVGGMESVETDGGRAGQREAGSVIKRLSVFLR